MSKEKIDLASESSSITRPQRWDSPFSDEMSDEIVDGLLAVPPFSEIDASRFPASASLRDILRNDARIVKFSPGDIVVREGDYGHSAFFILEGRALVSSDDRLNELLGRRKTTRKSFFEAVKQLWTNTIHTESRDLKGYASRKQVGARAGKGDSVRLFLQDYNVVLGNNRGELKAGEWFGEIAAMGRTPRTATVIADVNSVLLEIRWQGLRDLRQRAEEIKRHIDKRYRQHSLGIHLEETELFELLSKEERQEIAQQTVFDTYGNFEWFGTYQAMAEANAAQRLENEPLICREGDYPNGLVLIRSGFARLSEQCGNGHRTIRYLGKGQIYGLEEIAHNWRMEERVPLQHSLRAVGYVDVLVIPTAVVEKLVFSKMDPKHLPPLIVPQEKQAFRQATSAEVAPELLEFLVENRFINGTATMMIDLDRCTRCDDCVKACASTHDNNPRFLRHGAIQGHFMIANACMHCVDPVCMIGCPTGAIQRNAVGGQVSINDQTCIGCSTCANSCPYDNIRMVEIRDEEGAMVRDEKTGTPILKATKCDLCSEQLTGPACQNACPHDALKRVDMQQLHQLTEWVNR